MSFWEIFLIAFGLSMDAFAVSICKGLSVKKVLPKHLLLAGLYFGGFQALMPLIGYFLGTTFRDYITAYDHWLAFALLVFVGVNMIKEAVSKKDECPVGGFGFKTMLLLAVATSIDALAVGVSFAFLDVNIWLSVAVIGCTTFVLSAAGVKIGNVFGARYKSKAELAGGVILLLIGLKILIEGLIA